MSQTFRQHCGSLSIKGGGHTHSSCCGSSEWVSRSCKVIKAFHEARASDLYNDTETLQLDGSCCNLEHTHRGQTMS